MKRNLILGFIFAVLFVGLRFLAFPQMYQQDEYKWALIVNPAFGLNLESDHPPLVGFLYKMTGQLVGFEHLRILPIMVSLINILLIVLVVRKMYGTIDPAFGQRVSWWVVGILLTNLYFLIASTQIDIDGALLPCAMLLSTYCYLNIDWSDIGRKENRIRLAAFLGTIIFGFLIKLSFVLILATLATDFWIARRPNWKLIWKIIVWGLGALIILSGIVWFINTVEHVANSTRFLANTTKFGIFNFSTRNYSQVVFLSVKSFVVASPLLVIPVAYLIAARNQFIRHRIWWLYILYNFLFYFVVFDFTNRTIERYMMFLIIPCSIITAVFFAEQTTSEKISGYKKNWKVLIASLIVGCTPILMLLCNYSALPLNPKSAYLHKVASLDFRFLIPITGGSGPIGFYAPVLFILVSFSIAGIAFAIHHYAKDQIIKNGILVVVLVVGIVYNSVLISEYIGGVQFGNVNKVAQQVMSSVVDNPKIDRVITYYDIGGYELNAAHKYFKRFYTDPMFADTNIGKFSNYSGYYAVVNFPQIDTSSVYWKYLSTCATVSTTSDKGVMGYIFDCQKSDRALFGKK